MNPETRDPILTSRVRFEETDLQGIVFYGNYLTYMDMAHNEQLRHLDAGPGRGWSEHVVHTELDYRGQAKFGDEVHHYTRFSRIGTSSMETEYLATNGSGELLVEGEAVYVAMDDATDEPIPVPEAFREAVATSQEDPPSQ